MITPEYTVTMAAYNRWQNTNLINSAGRLSEADRDKDLGGFFKSINQTCYHILWGDSLWLSRFANTSPPQGESIGESVHECDNWKDYCTRRVALDVSISTWASKIAQSELTGDLTYYSTGTRQEITKPMGLLVTHLFNHQTHHRGQIHAMLTRLGAATEDTDMPLMPDDF